MDSGYRLREHHDEAAGRADGELAHSIEGGALRHNDLTAGSCGQNRPKILHFAEQHDAIARKWAAGEFWIVRGDARAGLEHDFDLAQLQNDETDLVLVWNFHGAREAQAIAPEGQTRFNLIHAQDGAQFGGGDGRHRREDRIFRKNRPMLLAVAFFILFQDPPAGDALPEGWRIFSGAGAMVVLPPGVVVSESTNGQAYLMDLTRPRVALDAVVPLLRIVIAPGTSLTADALAHLLDEAALADFTGAGFAAVEEASPIRASVAGMEREGTRRSLGHGGSAEWDLEVFAFSLGAQVAGMVTKYPSLLTDNEREAQSRLLSGIVLREIQGNEPILARIGSVGVRLPFMVPLDLRPIGDPPTWMTQVALSEGTLTLLAQDCQDPEQARIAAESAFGLFAQNLQARAQDPAEELEFTGQAGGWMPAGRGIVPFQRLAVVTQGQRQEILAAAVSDGRWMFVLQLTAPAESRAAADARFRQLLESLDYTDPRPPLRRFIGRGLRFGLPDGLRASAYREPHLVLQLVADHQHASDLPHFFMEWRDAEEVIVPESWHLNLRKELFPEREATATGKWSVASPWGVAEFLISVMGTGGEQGLLATSVWTRPSGSVVFSFVAPKAQNAEQLRTLCGRVLGGIEVLEPESVVRLQAGRAFLDLHDYTWLGWEWSGVTRPQVVVATAWGEFHLSFEELPDATLLSGEDLAAHAEEEWTSAFTSFEKDWERSGTQALAQPNSPEMGGTASVRRTLVREERSGFLETYAIQADRGLLRVWTFAEDAPGGPARAEITALLAAVGSISAAQ